MGWFFSVLRSRRLPVSIRRLIPAFRATPHRLLPQPMVGAATLALALFAVLGAWLRLAGGASQGMSVALLLAAVSLGGATLAAYRFPLHMSGHRKVQMATVPYYLLAVLVPPPLAALLAGGGALGGELLVREQRGSTASDIASAVGRRMLIVLLGGLVAQAPLSTALRPLALIAAAGVMGAADVITLPLVVAPMSGDRPLRVIARTVHDATLVEGIQYLIGLLGALAATQQLWVLALLTGPTMLVYVAFRATAQAEAAQRVAETAQSEAVQALRVRDTFLARASHDLRTPLTSIMGRAELMKGLLDLGSPLTDDWLRQQNDLQMRLARRMAAIIEDITDAAHLEMGQHLNLRADQVDMGALVQGVVLATGAVGRAHVVVDTVPGLVVTGDRPRLERVVQNILDNALKYSLPTTPIRVQMLAQKQWAVLTVCDSGVGIPAEELSLIFTPYYRASTARTMAGSGLGLAGARALVEQHGGDIALESTLGQGTTVVVRLPGDGGIGQDDGPTPRQDPAGGPGHASPEDTDEHAGARPDRVPGR